MLNLKNEDFRKLETLFKVGNTEVNQVRISHLNQLCVVKIQKVNSIEEANSMSRECYSLASNSHSNIVKLIGCTLVGNERNLTSVMIFLEYCSQGPLNEHFNTFRDSINEDTIYYYLFQAVEALSFLQEREVSHRDIKPENILITDNGKTLKISDLGCCTKIDASTLTLKGTANYLSPKLRKRHELNQENAEYKVHHNSYKSDVFSLGLIILSMLQEGFNNTQYNRLDNLENLICEKVGKIKNQFFRQLIIKMLEFDEDRRMDFIELKDFLHQNHVILPEHFCQKCMKYCPSLTFRYIRGASFCEICCQEIEKEGTLNCEICENMHMLSELYIFECKAYGKECLQPKCDEKKSLYCAVCQSKVSQDLLCLCESIFRCSVCKGLKHDGVNCIEGKSIMGDIDSNHYSYSCCLCDDGCFIMKKDNSYFYSCQKHQMVACWVCRKGIGKKIDHEKCRVLMLNSHNLE